MTVEAAQSDDVRSIEVLLLATAAGDRAAFAALYQRSSARCFGIALRVLGRRDWAEDVVQEAFIRVWHKAEQYRPEHGRAAAWMSVMVRHLAIDHLRRQRPERPTADLDEVEQWADPNPGPLEHALQSSEGRALLACLGELEPPARQSILLAFYEGCTHEEVADRLKRPLGTVKSWVRRSLLRLKACLDHG